MKRNVLLLVAFFALAFGLITFWKASNSVDPALRSADDSLRRQRLTDFWDSYHEGTRLRTAGLFGDAAESYLRALEVNPEHEESFYYLGNCWFELGEYEKAREVFENLTEVNPESHRAYAQLGVVLSSFLPGAVPDLSRARLDFERNAALDPEESGPFLRLGRVALSQKKMDDAYRYFQTAAGFASPEGAFQAGFVRFSQERYWEAKEWFEQVLHIGLQERKIAERGAVAEGDTGLASATSSMSPLRRAERKAQLYSTWSALLIGKQKSNSPSTFDAPALEVIETQRLALEKEDLGRGAWADYDLDGDPDLIVLSGDKVSLFENSSGNFRDRTGAVGLGRVEGAWDASWVDYDGDRDLDLYLIRSGFLGEGQNLLLRNDQGQFHDVTQQLGLIGRRSTSKALFFDFDRDGRQDLLETGNGSGSFAALRLFRNEGGIFREISGEMGLVFMGTAVDCAVDDYDLDGDDDLFVLRWRRPAILFRNQSGLMFRDATSEAGLENAGGNGYSALFLDFNADGRSDVLVTEYADFGSVADCLLDSDCNPTKQIARLFKNAGKGRFEESDMKGALNRPFGVIQAVTADFNDDGWPDLLFANGSLEPTRHEPSRILLNDRAGGFSGGALLPGFQPSNSVGVDISQLGTGDTRIVYLAGVGLITVRPLGN